MMKCDPPRLIPPLAQLRNKNTVFLMIQHFEAYESIEENERFNLSRVAEGFGKVWGGSRKRRARRKAKTYTQFFSGVIPSVTPE